MRFAPICTPLFLLVSAIPALAQVKIVNPNATDVVNPGTNAWFEATKTGRADMLILGDSNVWHMDNGWDAGFVNALANRTGIASSGVLGHYGIEGDGYGVVASTDFKFDVARVRADRQGFAWRSAAVTAMETPVKDYIAYVGNSTLKGSQYDFHLYSVPTGSIGTYQYYERVSASPWTASPVSPTQDVTLTGKGLTRETMRFARPTGADNQWLELRVTNAANMSVMYSRISVPGATGASVTSWGYGGRSALDFYKDQWTGQGVTPDGRKAWLDAMTDGGSGKVNVVIAEGFNDRNETDASLAGTSPGSSALAFSDNIKGLIAQVRKEWTASGRKLEDLSFTLLGMYDDGSEDVERDLGTLGPLQSYAIELHKIAKADPNISFVNLINHVPDYDTLQAQGWLYDPVHFSRQGAINMSQIVVDTLRAPTVPEPTTLGFLSVGGIACLLRRRRR